MKLESMIHMEVEKNERKYHLCLPYGAPYGELYDAIYEMLEEAVKMANKAVEQAKREEPPAEEK